jgi:acyl transferase domain-containing protein/acyl carrier protein
MSSDNPETGLEIAVIGMAGRFPGAKDIEQFWENLKNGIESIIFYSPDELLSAGVSTNLLDNPDYVKCGGGIMEEIEYFDAGYFGYSPIEAELMDPQVRIFHEITWHALENAGYDPFTYDQPIGIYAGASRNIEWEALSMLSGKTALLGDFASQFLTDRDFLCTRVSYNLNLKGPGVVVKTACSTSLAAVHMACQSILNGECEMSLAGGVSITRYGIGGYLYREGMIPSKDGHCRAFDVNSLGTVGGSGAGVVVLKRLENARHDNDNILALIKGSAINNDGMRRAGFTAPSIDGQCEVICDAIQFAGIDPETVTCIETHGTGTPVGDPIELEALKLAFDTTKKQYCRIGSVKTNVGHLDAAAGITGLIKTVLMLKHRLIPPSLHFNAPNPRFDMENSPFIVNTGLYEWENNDHPLRAGVSSFGIGGTNVHVILEEAPEGTGGLALLSFAPLSNRQYQLILLSAKTETALDKMTENLTEYLKNNLLNPGNPANSPNPGPVLADTAYTLQVGRRALPYRRMTVCPDVDSAIAALSTPRSNKVRTSQVKDEKISIIFMFPGLGAEYVNMGRGLYQTEPAFREEMDHCFEILNGILDYDAKEILYPGLMSDQSEQSDLSDLSDLSDINRTEITQPVIFAFEYSLARLLMAWGIKPQAMIGYSFGEYTAACLSGVFSLEDALKVIAARGKLIGKLPGGTMLSIPLSREDIKPYLTAEISIAIDNGPSCIAAGPAGALAALQEEMKKLRCICVPMPNTHAIHSPMMDPILREFETCLGKISLNKPQIPYISNVTANWITPGEATKPHYWAVHLRETVRFTEGIQRLLKEPHPLFIEIGPGRDLNSLLVRHQQEQHQTGPRAVNLIKPARDKTPDDYYFINKLGLLWTYGVKIHWNEFYNGEQRKRIPLPLYPFEGKRYWNDIDPAKVGETKAGGSLIGKKPDRADWFYTQQWQRTTLITRKEGTPAPGIWLLFIDDTPLGNQLVKRLEDENHRVAAVKPGKSFKEIKADEYTINPADPGEYDILFKRLAEAGTIPGNIVHMWSVTGDREHQPGQGALDRELERGLYSLLSTAGAIGSANISQKIQLGVITANMQYVTGEEELYPERAAILGPVKIIPIEYPNISSRSIDIIEPGENRGKIEFIIENLLLEFSSGFADQPVVAYRGLSRWQETFAPVKLGSNPTTSRHPRLKEKGVYLVTGGFGGMGFVLAEHLVNTLNARLVLVDILTPPSGQKLDKWLYSDERKKEIQEKKQKIKEWETEGAEIQVHDVDVSDYQGMKNVISQAEERYGQINGVIHTAGLIDYAGVIQRRTREMTAEILAAKIKGTLVLDELLGHHQLDFMVLFSSVGNVLYRIKFGQVGYNAGHEFLDVYSYYKQQQGQYTVAIDWNDWTEVGMAERAAQKHYTDSRGPSAEPTGEEDLLSISPAEGIDVFHRVVENNINRVVVSHHDLHRLMEFMNNLTRRGAQTGSFDQTGDKTASRVLHERPAISADYEPPTNELQEFILGIWEKILGINPIGIMDDWFELGGDSLTVTQLIARIRELYPVEISVNIFFENPTIAGLAGMIEELLYEKVQGLSEEELDALVEQEKEI